MNTLNSDVVIDPKEFGVHLRKAREAAKLSRADIHKKTNIPVKAIEKFERGEQEVSVFRAISICKCLGISFDHLMADLETGSLASPGQDGNESYPVLVSSNPDPENSDEHAMLEEAGAIIDRLDRFRAEGFEGLICRALVSMDHAFNMLEMLEPPGLLSIAHDAQLSRKSLPTPIELEDAFEEDFDTAIAQRDELINRIIDTAVFGYDLYQVDIDLIKDLADHFEREDHIENASGLTSHQDGHAVFVPLVRKRLRQLALTGRAPMLANIASDTEFRAESKVEIASEKNPFAFWEFGQSE
ncbi:helix-turn-helix domain-containing protein [Denitrobaculum tricleocarpae]|uniref:Helix-turn-helix transcriptional regulator n=1 Tax=Denitrobaculum tricleocarpae TaxID=2591009 RepID=A0A545TXE6_9PROT|nr:helix-turn-helix transcriptional regulator [Denitrobaculum tricleocarpae]TQV81905.1 helix-turn-helix transcriptional regulator [Denitrobaculum tricleocarpae]